MGGMYDKAWTEEEEKQATDLYKGGTHIELIATELGRTYSSVQKKLYRLCVYKPAKRYTWTDEEEQQLMDLHDAGYTFEQIGETLGRSYGSVSSKFSYITKGEDKMTSTEIKKQWKPDPNKFIMIDGEKLRAELKKRSLKQADIARETGVSKSALSHSINKGYLQPYTMKLLTLCYDIKLEDILPDKEEEPVAVAEETPEVTIDIRDQELQWDLFLKKLGAVIEDAAYRGVKRALDE